MIESLAQMYTDSADLEYIIHCFYDAQIDALNSYDDADLISDYNQFILD